MMRWSRPTWAPRPGHTCRSCAIERIDAWWYSPVSGPIMMRHDCWCGTCRSMLAALASGPRSGMTMCDAHHLKEAYGTKFRLWSAEQCTRAIHQRAIAPRNLGIVKLTTLVTITAKPRCRSRRSPASWSSAPHGGETRAGVDPEHANRLALRMEGLTRRRTETVDANAGMLAPTRSPLGTGTTTDARERKAFSTRHRPQHRGLTCPDAGLIDVRKCVRPTSMAPSSILR